MDRGIYCLIFQNPVCSLPVGALGEIPFRRGWHIYVGSALGSGGLKRLERHIRLARIRDRRPKWHVDYLLVSDNFILSFAAYTVTTKRLECDLAKGIQGEPVPDFGCSDCNCRSHLIYRDHNPASEVAAAFRALHLSPAIKTIMSRKIKAYI